MSTVQLSIRSVPRPATFRLSPAQGRHRREWLIGGGARAGQHSTALVGQRRAIAAAINTPAVVSGGLWTEGERGTFDWRLVRHRITRHRHVVCAVCCGMYRTVRYRNAERASSQPRPARAGYKVTGGSRRVGSHRLQQRGGLFEREYGRIVHGKHKQGIAADYCQEGQLDAAG